MPPTTPPGSGVARRPDTTPALPASSGPLITRDEVEHLSTFGMLPLAVEMANAVCRTEFVPKAMRGKPDVVAACILAGHSLGLDPMVALANIDVIEGRPAPSAKLMRAMVQAKGHSIAFEEKTNERVTIVGQRDGEEFTSRVTWTMDDARRANLANKQVWKNYPRAMLAARATGELCRDIFADVVAGLAYTREEVADGFDDFDGLEAEQGPEEEPPPAGNQRSLTPAKKAPAKKAAARKRAAPKTAAGPRAVDTDELVPLPDEEPADVRSTPPTGASLRQRDAESGTADEDDDGDVVDAEVVDEPADEVDEETRKRAQRIAIKAREAGIGDHHDVVYAVTAGQSTSAKDLTDAQGSAVLDAIRRIKIGELVLDTDGAEPTLVEVALEPAAEPDPDPATPPAPAEPDPDDPWDLANVDGWDGDKWREYVQGMGLKVVQTIKEAKRIAAEAGLEEPTTLNDLQGQPQLSALVLAWAEEQGQ